MSRRAAFIALGVLGLQALVCAWAFTPAPSQGGDNHAYVLLADALLERGAYVSLWEPAVPLHTKYPPLFPALLTLWLGPAGVTTWAGLKSVPVFLMLLASGLVFVWVERRKGARFAALVSVLTVVSGGWVWASRWVLSDPLFVVLVLLSFYALERGEGPGDGDGEGSRPARRLWTLTGIAAAALSALARSVGLSMVIAVSGWFVLRRRWKALGTTIGLASAMLLPWLVRTATGGSGGYLDEVWRVDGFRPELGRVGIVGIGARALENLGLYGTRWVPEALGGVGTAGVPFFGTVIVLLATLGWFIRARRGAGPAELFAASYLALLLLWPSAYGHFRFAIPLIPLVVFYAVEAVSGLRGRWRTVTGVVGVAAGAPLAGVALMHLAATGLEARACAAEMAELGAYGCYGPEWLGFQEAAGWSGANLPAGSVVLSAKPEMFYAMSGIRGLVHPATGDADEYLRQAERSGARYALLDSVWPPATERIQRALERRREAFCLVKSFERVGEHPAGPTHLLGIPGTGALPPPRQERSRPVEGNGFLPRPCPASMSLVPERLPEDLPPGRIPVLEGMVEPPGGLTPTPGSRP